jgi:type II secretory pathway component PulC
MLRDPTGLAASMRILPGIRDGKLSGLKIYAVHPAGYGARLGLQSGDTVVKVNGAELSQPTSPDQLLAHGEALNPGGVLKLEILRRGQPMTLEYTIK